MRLTGLTLPILLGALLIQVVTAMTKPGKCPRSLKLCTEDLKRDCLSDDNCNGTRKCCQDDCQYSCKDPVGLCPSEIPMKDHNYTGDQDYNGSEKCCMYDCQYRCKDPAELISRECPKSLILIHTFPLKMAGEDCQRNRECIGGKKCCLIFCRLRCKDPEV